MWPWIGLTAFSLVLKILILILNILKVLISLDTVIATVGYFGVVIGVYLFLVVWSFKAEVEGGEEDQGEAHLKREEREMLNA